MKINHDQLERHLQQGLQPLYLVSGDEPLLVQESCQLIRDTARQQGFSSRERYYVEGRFDWQDVLMSANSLSLFAERKLIELDFKNGKFAAADAEALQTLLAHGSDDNLLLISMPRFEGNISRDKTWKLLDERGVTLRIWPVERQRLPQWIQGRLRQHQLDASAEAIQFLADNVEGNLLAARQEIEKLALISDGGVIDLDAMTQAVSNASRYTVFNYLDKCLAGDLAGALKTLQGLKDEGSEAPILLWGIGRELRLLLALHRAGADGQPIAQAMRNLRVPDMRQRLVQTAVSRLPPARLYRLLEKARRIDQSVKGIVKESPWLHLEQLTLAFCRSR